MDCILATWWLCRVSLALIIREHRPLPKCYLAIRASGRCLFTSHVIFLLGSLFLFCLKEMLDILWALTVGSVYTCLPSLGVVL